MTHEVEIAAQAPRVIRMQDGRLQDAVSKPLDADVETG
jgi:ABC-type lipoprotein export system ATPase subunit